MKKYIKTLLSLTLILFSICLSGCSFITSTNYPSNSNSNNNSSNNSNNNSDDDSDDSLSESLTYYHDINETFTFDGLEYTFTSYEFRTSYWTYEPDNGNKFCVVYLTIHNPTPTTKSLKTYGQNKYIYRLIGNDEYKYLSSYGYYEKFLLLYDSLVSLETKQCVLLYEVPKTGLEMFNKLTLEISFNSIFEDEVHNVMLLDETLV